MEKQPLVSIVMPAYNVEKFIGQAIDSVLKQDFQNWELVIVNDCSSDRTIEIIQQYSDERIRLYHTDNNSGSAYIPREMAVNYAKGEYIVLLDADDFYGDNYLSSMVKRVVETDADICIPQLVVTNEKGDVNNPIGVIPKEGFDFSQVMTGKEAFCNALPTWNIGFNGAMVKKKVYSYVLNKYSDKRKSMIHADENISYLSLRICQKVVFSNSEYFFRQNSSSVTHQKISLKSFDLMDSIEDLRSVVAEQYGIDSEEYLRANIYDCRAYTGRYKTFLYSLDEIKNDVEIRKCFEKIKAWHSRVGKNIFRKEEGWFKGWIRSKFYLSVFLRILGRPGNLFRILSVYSEDINYGWKRYSRRLLSDSDYRWSVLRKDRELEGKNKILYKYAEKWNNEIVCSEKCIICMFDGAVRSGGLADRLRGILSVFSIAKRYGHKFRLFFREPFPLEDFFVPNEYDWKIEDNCICYNRDSIDIVVLDTTEDTKYQWDKQKEYLDKRLCCVDKQVHMYTNAAFIYNENYSELFHELFRPSDRLAKAIEQQHKIIGGKYISVSCRFLDLLGDFNETCGYGEKLPKEKADVLISGLLNKIQELHKHFPDMKILINSDSITFLKCADVFDYTYVIPGNITHIDSEHNEYCYERFEKTFLDFMMIAGAERIYLLVGNRMYRSNYPFAASHVYNRPFEIIDL